MLPLSALAQAGATGQEANGTAGEGRPEASAGAVEPPSRQSSEPPQVEALEAPPSDPLRPVQVFQTEEGVIVLSNRPREVEAAPASDGAEVPPAAPAPGDQAAPAVSAARAPRAVSERPSEPWAEAVPLGAWVALSALAVSALLWLLRRWRRQRSAAARTAALLAASVPRPTPRIFGDDSPFERAPADADPLTPPPSSERPAELAAEPLSARRAQTPLSGLGGAPPSERQWLSQPPPRGPKEPPP